MRRSMQHADHEPLPLHTHRRSSYLQSGNALLVPATSTVAGALTDAFTGTSVHLQQAPCPKRQPLQAFAGALPYALARILAFTC